MQELFQRCYNKANMQNGNEGGNSGQGVEMFERSFLARRRCLAKDGRSLRQRAFKMNRAQWSFTAGFLLVMASRSSVWFHRVHKASNHLKNAHLYCR